MTGGRIDRGVISGTFALDGETFEVDNNVWVVGAVCLYVAELGCVFTGDTLFHGGPDATGRSYSDRGVLEDSIRAKLFALPDATIVHTGHGEDTTIGAERERGL